MYTMKLLSSLLLVLSIRFLLLLNYYGVDIGVSTLATPTPLTSKKSSSSSSPSANNNINLSNEERQILINKANEFPDSTYKGWSNRVGKVITPVHCVGNNNNVYCTDRQFIWYTIDVGGRCTIIELPNAGSEKPDLWIHSPVSLYDDEEYKDFKSSLELIGNVKYIVSPNYEHLKYANQWYTAYKDTKNGVSMWGCPGLRERLPDIKWDGEIPYNYRPIDWKKKGTSSSNSNSIISEKCWDTSILQPIHLNIEVNPFTNKPFFNEVLFYHKPTKSLITTDFYWNYPNKDGITNSQLGYDGCWELAPAVSTIPFRTALWKFGMDQIYKPFFQNFMVSKFRNEYNEIIQFLLNENNNNNVNSGWDIETIIPCHGDIVRGKENVRMALKQALL